MSKRIETLIAQADKNCTARGTRLTAKRKQVLAGLLNCKRALSAYELVDYCEQEFGETFSAMSVYRILEFLEQEQLAHRLNLANKYVACSHICEHHSHDAPQFLICQSCHKVSEIIIPPNTVSALKQTVADAGFELKSPQIEMNCICNDCKTKALGRDHRNKQHSVAHSQSTTAMTTQAGT
ncbi:Fur family transcriptional regulator [Gilvimarinus chinensis]|uniref:Fur family transcriptional regulator n=1 Tax=Gilvimarinus chinensis TaxID=396005 RepID=UPI0003663EC8|nr:transcriptional repressor [Gilvimarinus chinensis]